MGFVGTTILTFLAICLCAFLAIVTVVGAGEAIRKKDPELIAGTIIIGFFFLLILGLSLLGIAGLWGM